MRIQLPYGKGTLPLDIPDINLIDVVLPQGTTTYLVHES